MAETQVLVRNAGVVECDLGSSQTLDFTAYVEFDNKWETTTEYVYGDEVLDAYNAEHGTNYLPIPTDAVTFTPAQLEVGKREAVSHFEIDKSKLTPDRFYTLAVQLKSNSEFKIGADNTVLYHIALNPLFTDRSKWILVACSSWYTGRGPELTIDGDVSTKFENRYNDIGQGDIETLPVTIDWDLGKTCYYAGMKLTRRNDSYVTDLKAGWIGNVRRRQNLDAPAILRLRGQQDGRRRFPQRTMVRSGTLPAAENDRIRPSGQETGVGMRIRTRTDRRRRMIPPMNHSNYRLPVLPFAGRTGSRLKSFVMTCSLIFAAAGFCLAATNCSNGNNTSDTPPALSFENRIESARSGRNLPPDAAHPPRRRCERHRIRHGRQPAGRDIPLFFAADSFGRCTGHRHGPQRRYGDRNS